MGIRLSQTGASWTAHGAKEGESDSKLSAPQPCIPTQTAVVAQTAAGQLLSPEDVEPTRLNLCSFNLRDGAEKSGCSAESAHIRAHGGGCCRNDGVLLAGRML